MGPHGDIIKVVQHAETQQTGGSLALLHKGTFVHSRSIVRMADRTEIANIWGTPPANSETTGRCWG